MYHPTRGGVRGGRDQFSWDDVKVDKHRENYLGHSIKAPVGRWQKEVKIYTGMLETKKAQKAEMDAAKEEIKRIKEEEEQAMREALGLAPKRASRAQGSRLDKHEFSELVKRGSTAEDVGEGHAEAARVHGLGFARAPCPWDESSSLHPTAKDVPPEMGKLDVPNSPPKEKVEEELEDESSRKKRRRDERKQEKHERREKHGKRPSDERRKDRKHKEKRRHGSDAE